MKISIISFTENGIHLSEKISKTLAGQEYTLFTKCSAHLREDCLKKAPNGGIQFVGESVAEWTKSEMAAGNVLIFIGACAIAVRAAAPNITDKLHDSPVLVIDEKGQYVIPILSGHMGGANEYAISIAEKIGAIPVITTATDINHKFAVDIFAKKNGLAVVNKDGIAKVSSKVLSGQKITISIEPGHYDKDCRLPNGVELADYPPKHRVDVVVSSEQRGFDTAILLRPREYVIGMGCRKGKEAEKIEELIEQSINELGISVMQTAKLASIDVKSNEQGLVAWSRKYNIPFVTYTAQELESVSGDFHKSDFVKNRVGVDNVCERAALKACDRTGKLVYEKHAKDGMTIAIAGMEWSVGFDEI